MEEKASQESFKNYILFWSGQQFSLLGSFIVQFVIIWWITIETESAIMLALANFFYLIPVLIFTPIAGVYADRWNKKTIIIVVDSLQAYFTLILIIFFVMDFTELWAIFTIIGLRSMCQAFHSPTVSSLTPAMVPKDKLSRMNGLNYLFTGLIQLIGPAVAATLLLVLSIKFILWLDILTFMIALIPLLIIKIPKINNIEQLPGKKSFFKDLRIGFRIIKVVPGLLIIILLAMLINFLIQPLSVLMPLYIYDVHLGDLFIFALMEIIFQGSMIAGAILTSIKKDWKHKIRVIFISIIIINIGYMMYALAPIGNFSIIIIGSIIAAFSLPIVNTILQTIMQTTIPVDKFGRAISIVSTLAMVITPLAAIISGPLAEVLGISTLFFFCAILGLIITIITYTFTGIRHVDYNQPIEIEISE